VNYFQKSRFNLNQINNSEDTTELRITENDLGQLKAGISFQEYVSRDNIITCEIQILEQMMANILELMCPRRRNMVEK
jgi:hypothetical protein